MVNSRGFIPTRNLVRPILFILLINDLSSQCGMHKFVNDVTLSEVINSSMCANINNVVEWSDNNLMNINIAKTEEMLIGRIKNEPPPKILLCGKVTERVSSFRLLGVQTDNNLEWARHTAYIYSEASSRLYFMNPLQCRSSTQHRSKND